MSVWLFWMSLVLMCVASSLTVADSSNDTETSNLFVQEMIVRAHQKLTSGLYRAFSRKEGNMLISPWGVMSLLTVTYMVASGRTASDIGDHLRINLLRKTEILDGFQHINQFFNGSADETDDSTQVLSVHSAYMQKDMQVSNRLQRKLRNSLNTYISHVITGEHDDNNSNSSLVGGQRLIELVREKTHGLLGDELPVPHKGLADKISLWLFSILYFEGTWRNQFNPALTSNASFLANGRSQVNVETMVTTAKFPRSHYKELQTTLLELAYGHSGRYSMFILLPDNQDGLPALEKALRPFELEAMLSEQHWARHTKVFLPKFKFQTSIKLNSVMKRLGFKRMFSQEQADFSRLTPPAESQEKALYVQRMTQKAAIEVNELGTKAASVTSLNVVARRYVHYMPVDHPFMFVVRDKALAINLFVGRVTDPRRLIPASDA